MVRHSPAASRRPPRPFSDRLSAALIDDLPEWNNASGQKGIDARTLQGRGQELAIRVQDELGTDDWEVPCKTGSRMHRVHPAGSWPIDSWQRELPGYSRP
jgi:hypothetical protein